MYYAIEYTNGKGATWAGTGKDVYKIHAFQTAQDRNNYVSDYKAPNHAPTASAEKILAKHANVAAYKRELEKCGGELY